MKYLLYVGLVSVLLLEIILRVSGEFDTYFEKTGQWNLMLFNSVLGFQGNSKYYTLPSNTRNSTDHGEFRYVYETNQFGFIENKNSFLLNSDSTLRVLVLGDSFVEGVGAPADSSWPRVLERRLNKYCQAEVYNAGVSGSDPFYNFVLLRDKLVELKPDIVIQSFNSTDLDDHIIRGGMERFCEKNKLCLKKLPWWEPFFRISHLFRSIVFSIGYNHLLVMDDEMPELYQNAAADYQILLDKYSTLSEQNGFELICFIIPEPYYLNEELRAVIDLYETRDYEFLSNQVKQPNGLAAKYTSLKKIALRNSQNFKVIDLLHPLSMKIYNPAKYSWSVDGHYNSLGYSVVAEVVANQLINQHVIAK